MEVSDFLLTRCVWGMGMLLGVFNVEMGNNYSKSTFIMTLIKQEKLVFILVILYIREYLCVFTKLFMGTRVSKDFQFRISVPEITDNAQPYKRNTPHSVLIHPPG